MATCELTFDELLDQKPSLAEVCEHARTSKCHQLGIQLGLDDIELEDIKEDRSNAEEKRTKVYQLWFRTQPKATRRQLLTALKSASVGEGNRVAISYEEMIRKKAAPTEAADEVDHKGDTSLLDTTVSDKDIYKIAQTMITWESIPLGLTQSDMETIKRDNLNDYTQQKMQSLYKWRQRNGSQATYRNLVNTVCPQSKELADHIITLIGEEDNSSLLEGQQPTSILQWDDTISDTMISQIGEVMISWEDIRIGLGLTLAEEVVIKRNYKGDYERQKRQVLFKWREKHGQSEATYRNLVKILTECKENNLAEYITKSIKSFK